MATPGRKNDEQLMHEISDSIGLAQINSTVPILLGSIPAGAILDSYHFVTSQAFDPTTAGIRLGTTPGGAEILANTSIKALARVDAQVGIAGSGFFAVDTPIYWTPTITGGPATVGAATIWLTYLPGPG